MASGAGLNRVGTLGGVPLLTIPPGVQTPAAVAYGSYGVNTGPATNQSQMGNYLNATVGTDSGVQMVAAAGFSKWGFYLVGPGATATGTAAYAVAIYGTFDPTLLGQAYQTGATLPGTQGHEPGQTASLTAIPATSWFLLPSPSDQSGTGLVSNPIVTSATGSNCLIASLPLVAVRAVLVGTAPTTGTAPVTVVGFAIP